ncbi:MAG: RNA polymerase factor sigma-54 [Chitinophagales bacterium]|nr:RNA polymerase factor sigma-54 [Chitinophagales bacterium]MDW8417915.1 RNA polymerase factor sigma-54 [Chitinophagales bacterium]
MLNQRISQKLLQKLSPQQIQLMKLLQIPTANLEQRIKEELEANPALEEGDGDSEELPEIDLDINDNDPPAVEEEDQPSEEEDTTQNDEEFDIQDGPDMSEYFADDDGEIAEYKIADPNAYHDPDNDKKTIPVSTTSTFHEYLEQQIGLLNLDERRKQIAMHIVGSIDDDGYLRRDIDTLSDEVAFRLNIQCSPAEVEEILSQIHKLDPPGVGARSLEECLLIQLRRKENKTYFTELAIKTIEQHFELFAKKHYEKLARALDISDEALKDVVDEIIHLNPKPGSNFSGGGGEQYIIVPDYILTNNGGELQLSLNSANAPELRISAHFREMIDHYKKSKDKSKQQKEAMLFIKQKIDSAKWFIDAIKSRYHTMLAVMQAIMDIQKEYLTTGDETLLKPMILKDVAERTGLDISTVSRVANSKYVQTEFGTIPLKFFFSEALSTDSGEEVSTREVKKILSELIAMESKRKPISDEKLTQILRQRGYNIARRTVAKYREQLNIPVARLRKEL